MGIHTVSPPPVAQMHRFLSTCAPVLTGYLPTRLPRIDLAPVHSIPVGWCGHAAAPHQDGHGEATEDTGDDLSCDDSPVADDVPPCPPGAPDDRSDIWLRPG